MTPRVQNTMVVLGFDPRISPAIRRFAASNKKVAGGWCLNINVVTHPSETFGSPPSNGSLGSGAAVRHNARMLQHCLSKQTSCRRDCRPLECQELPSRVLAEGSANC